MKFKPNGLSISISGFCVLFGALIAVGCDDDGSGIRSARFGEALVSPESIQVPKVTIGESIDRVVTITNVGMGELKLANIDAQISDEFSLSWNEGPEPTQERYAEFPSVLTIPSEIECDVVEGCNVITLVLRYSPTMEGEPSGRIVMETNSVREDQRELVIPIQAARSTAELAVYPTTVQFGRVNVGETRVKEVVASNIGQVNLEVSSINLYGDNFGVTIVSPTGEEVNIADNPAALQDPDGDGSPGLAPNQSFQLKVSFTATFETAASGELSIISNSVVEDTRINLIANGAAPCLSVDPPILDYGAALIMNDNPGQISLQSCGGDIVEVSSIEVVDDGGGVFRIDETTLPCNGSLPCALPAAEQREDGTLLDPPKRDFNVIFNPPAEERYTGMLRVTSNDAELPTADVELRGLGSTNECPVARVLEPDFNVQPLDLVVLDGSGSSDPNGNEGLTYEWVVVERPDGSTSQPLERVRDVLSPGDGGEPDQINTPNAVFFVDLAGIYVIELRVTDPFGSTAPSDICPQEPARVTINALPSEDIHLQLVWDTPADMDQTDSDGTDVDMHFRHPNATDWEGSLDCYFANPNPDWGMSGSAADDPSLDIDDTDGAGPENINLDNPEWTSGFGMDRDGDGSPDGEPYQVGVHYYRSDSYGGFDDFFGGGGGSGAGDYGVSNATMRIYLGGVLAFEQTQQLNTTDDFWVVAAIVWEENDRRVIEIGDMTRRR